MNACAVSNALEGESVLNALGQVIIVVDDDGCILKINAAGEQFFQISFAALKKRRFSDLIPDDSPISSLVRQVQGGLAAVAEYGLILETPRIGKHLVNVQAAPLVEISGAVVLSMQERSITDQIDHRLTHRGAARSVSAMAAMLAHEVKNPLSGIRGAAQLLESSVDEQDHTLTRLIRDETDRIVALVDRMEVFSEGGPLKTEPVNIHQVLDRVRQLAENGFGRHIHFVERYDPSLPEVEGNRDQLMQVFLNLVKNACEAAPSMSGEVVLRTAYKHGVRFAMPGSKKRVHLPLMVSIVDNGAGIPDDIQPYLFDPFVTSKPKGSGLGLPLVAKIIGDHGGVIDFDSQPGRTEFKVMLPMAQAHKK